MEPLTSSIFLAIGSFLVTGAGNIPILLRTGPRTVGIFLTRESVAKRTEYFLATDSLVKKIPTVLGPVLNRIGMF